MAVLEDAFGLTRPDYNSLISTARCKALAITGERHAVKGVLVTLQRVQQIAINGVVDKDAAPYCSNELQTIGPEGDVVNAVLNAVALRHAVAPSDEAPHTYEGESR